jgi:hypothetical protein
MSSQINLTDTVALATPDRERCVRCSGYNVEVLAPLSRIVGLDRVLLLERQFLSWEFYSLSYRIRCG